jgi:hypothetical protein
MKSNLEKIRNNFGDKRPKETFHRIRTKLEPEKYVRVKANSITSMSRINSVRTPDQLFYDRELTRASISAVRVDEI